MLLFWAALLQVFQQAIQLGGSLVQATESHFLEFRAAISRLRFWP
jgi:hypothetical protein